MTKKCSQSTHHMELAKNCGEDMEENLQIFNRSVAEGSTYVCTCCQQLWFKHSAMNVASILMNKPDMISLFEQCHTNYISIHDIEWVAVPVRNQFMLENT